MNSKNFPDEQYPEHIFGSFVAFVGVLIDYFRVQKVLYNFGTHYLHFPVAKVNQGKFLVLK
jgi:hypothetical protein